jgi:O-methyltransferase
VHISQFITAARKLNWHEALKPLKKFMPWKFRRWVELNTHRELVSPEELKQQYIRALTVLSETLGAEGLGDYLEFGVSHGTSLTCMHKALKELDLANVRIFGFDSFEGLPENAKLEGNKRFSPGAFRSSIEKTKHFLTDKGIDWKKTFLIKGWYSDTLTEELKQKHNITRASVIMIDVDIYSSAREALNFCKSLILDTSIIFFDDWYAFGYAEKNLGEKKAFDEFLNENPQFKAESFGDYSFSGVACSHIVKIQNTGTV